MPTTDQSSVVSLSIGDILGQLTSGFGETEAAIIASVSAWSMNELYKLGMEEIQNCWRAQNHFLNNVRNGMSWGEAMANMLTEVWNDAKHELAMLATDFVEAVGKVFLNVGLLPAGA